MPTKAKEKDRRFRPLPSWPGETAELRRGKFALLTLLSEQRVIPIDQLRRFGLVPTAHFDSALKQLQADGCIQRRRLLRGDRTWVWLTWRGARLSGTGLRAREPGVSRLPHTRAINEVRLLLIQRAPEGHWVCERELFSRVAPGAHIPDAVIEFGKESHAIEVELSRKPFAELRGVIAAHSRHYDAVVYFCGPKTLGPLRRLKAGGRNPKLIVRPVPIEARVPTAGPGGREDGRRTRAPLGRLGREAVELVAEQGAVPLDQFARFLALREPVARDLAGRLHREGYLGWEEPLVDDQPWLALSRRGADVSRTGLRPSRASVALLTRRRALNEVRLHLAERAPQGRWISHRLLVHGHPLSGSMPGAVFAIGGERHAIDVELSAGKDDELAAKIEHRLARHDALVCFCAPAALHSLRRLHVEHGWRELAVRALPVPASEVPLRPRPGFEKVP